MKDEISRTIFQIVMTQFALESLRAKDVARTLEILELELDQSVLRMHTLAKDLDDPNERERVFSAFREVRGYRQAHPRRTESDLSTVARGVVARAIQVSKDRITKILNEAA